MCRTPLSVLIINSHYCHRMVAWYLFGLQGCISPILYSTVNVIIKDDAEERALVIVRAPTHNSSHLSYERC